MSSFVERFFLTFIGEDRIIFSDWDRFFSQKETVPMEKETILSRKKGGKILAKKQREFSSTDMYHIILRGNDKNDIFYDNQDRKMFLKIMEITKEKFKYSIYSYCLMNNHIHMVIKIKDEFLSKALQSLEIRYSAYFNKKTNRTGHLFQNRFFSKKIEDLNYFLTVCKYIHRNPEKANIEKTQNYQWSSFLEYIGKEKYIDKDILMYYFDNDIENFKKYTLQNDDKEQLYNLSEFEIKRNLSEEELIEIIKKKFDLKNASDVSIIQEEEKEKILLSLKELKSTSIAQISRVTKVTEYFIKKLWG